MKTKQEIKKLVDYLSDDKAEMLLKILKLPSLVSKGDLLEELLPEVDDYDSAYPQPYADRIRDIWPNFTKGFYIMDYSNNRISGELVNVNDLIVRKILKMK